MIFFVRFLISYFLELSITRRGPYLPCEEQIDLLRAFMRNRHRLISVIVVLQAALSVVSCGGGGGDSGGNTSVPHIVVTDSISPNNDLQLAFGSVTQGSSSDQTVTVTNSGSANLVISTIAAANTVTAPFSITADTCSGQTIAPAGTCTLTVRFAPAGTGSFTDSFDIPSNDPDTPTVTFSLSGTGTAGPVPNISVTDSIDPSSDLQVLFGSVVQGNTSEQTVTVTNTGTANLVIGTVANSNPLVAPFTITADTCSGQTIAPSEICSLTVRFAPSSINGYTDSFDIPSNDPDTPSVLLNLGGTGTAVPVPNISVNDLEYPTDDLLVPFGSWAQGNTASQIVTVKNTGTGSLVIGNVANANPLAAPFSITADTCSGQTIVPADTCKLTIRFAPTSVNSFSDDFDIPSNDPDTPTVTFSLTGTGTAALVPNISVTDSVYPNNDLLVSFGNVAQGNTSNQTVTVTNTGTGNLIIGSVASANPLAAPFSITANGCSGHTLAPGAACILAVRFAPGSLNAFTDSFDIPSNDPDTPSVTVSVAGVNSPQMGGSIQGNPLALANAVSTVAGLPLLGAQDGMGTSAQFNGPYGIATDGTNLYVADTNNQSVRQIVISTGAVTTIASGLSPRGITTDGTNLYVTNDSHVIRKIVISTGAVTTFAGTIGSPGTENGTCSAARFNYPRGITTDGTNLYVADTGSHTIRKIVLSTCDVTTLAGLAGPAPEPGSADGTGGTARFNYPTGITTDGTNLYVADTNNHTIRQIVISSRVVTTLAGTAGSAGTVDATGATATFNNPEGITTDGTNLYVADMNNHAVRQIVISTGAVTTFAGTSGSSGNSDGTGSAARFYYPTGIIRYGTNLYLAESNNHTIRQIVIPTSAVNTLAGSAGSAGSADGTGMSARFYNPGGVATDGMNLYVADTKNHTVRKMVISNGAVTTLAGAAGSPGSGDGLVAGFNTPYGITTDGTNVYVADTNNHTIRQIVISTGDVATLAGTAGSSGSVDGTGAAARFKNPYGITTDGGYLYVADSFNCTVRQIVIATRVVTTLAGNGTCGYATNGTGTAARFSYPYGITTDGMNLYVTDTSNNAIRKIVISTGAVTTLAGSGLGSGSFGFADGTGSAAQFWNPSGITTDGTNLYVVDTNNRTVRKIVTSTGAVTTPVGTAPLGSIGSADGTGSAARFNYPYGITTDGVSLYLTDSSNNSIRKIE